MGFVHLHNHTQYSALDGACRTDKIIELTKKMGMTAVAITDHGTMSGVIDFYEQAIRNGIKPILGIEAYVINGELDDPDAKKDTLHHLTLLVKNKKGYQNLIKLSSIAYLDGFYYKPRMSKSLLEKYSEGLICLSGCIRGEIPSLLLQGREEETVEAIDFYKRVFPDNYYLELMDHRFPNEIEVMPKLIELGKRTNTPFVVTNDCHYLHKEDAEAHDVLLCIQTGKTLNDQNRLKYETDQLYFKSEEEMRELFPELPEAYENTVKIAEQVDFKFEYKEFLIPKAELPEKYFNETEYLKDLCYSNAEKKYPEVTEEIKKRIDYELSVINRMGYENYFLVVKDLVDAAVQQDIPVGPGRGSAAGSIVSYLLGITQIDPIKFNLFFERFLNPERIEMPDIDIDFCAQGRNQVIDYVIEKYGRDSVSQIITFSTLSAKAVIKDVARVLEVPPAEANNITKLMPNTPRITLEKCLAESPEFASLMANNRQYSQIIKHATVIEGLIRQHGIHAAGVVIGPSDLSNYLPLAVSRQKGGQTAVLVQFEGKWLDYLKLLKMDILGLKTLTILKRAVQIIEESTGVSVDLSNLDFSDKKVYELFSKGATDGVFQFESAGMKKYLKDLKPNVFADLIAMVALYRPGPMQHIDTYIKRKYGLESVEYDHPLTESALKETYGVIIYQEQVMQMSRDLAGFTGAEADTLRKAMGKKDQRVMDRLKSKFWEGASAKGVDEPTIQKIWNKWLEFANYAFNKSHSVCYAYVAFQTAYLKAHYPVEFMAAILSIEDDPTKIPYFLEECKNMELEVIPPNINISKKDFTVSEGKILFGLRGIKNVGDVAIQRLLEERDENGRFSDIFEFCSRVDLTAVNRMVIESLVFAGALDDLEGTRAQKAEVIDTAIEYGNNASNERKRGQFTLFDAFTESHDDDTIPTGCKPVLPEDVVWNLSDKLEKENSVLGFYISGHPLTKYHNEIKYFCNYSTKLYNQNGGETGRDRIRIIGLVNDIVKRRDNRSRIPNLVIMEDEFGRFELAIPNRDLAKYESFLEPGEQFLIDGKIDTNAFDKSVLRIYPNQLIRMDDLASRFSGEITLVVDESDLNESCLTFLDDLNEKTPGSFNLNFSVRTKKFQQLKLSTYKYKVYPSAKFLHKVEEFFGEAPEISVNTNEL
ncbi:MAG: DNA polymerase III subunit alpha [Candidatus Cloacimonadia bacterium]